MPGRVYFGDITSDGFPDILVTLSLKSGKSKVFNLINHPCTNEICSFKQVQANRRTFLYKNHTLLPPLIESYDNNLDLVD